MNAITHLAGNGQPALSAIEGQPTQDNPVTWLQDKIRFYEAEVTRLESELTHTRALLKGHQIWLNEAQKAGEQ